MKEMAAILKTERLRRGLTLHEASERSRINMSILKALEQRQFDNIGPPSVVRGLLMDYSFALGIGEDVLKQECRISDAGNEKTVSPQPGAQFNPPQSVGKGSHRSLLLGIILGMVPMERSLVSSGFQMEKAFHPDRDRRRIDLPYRKTLPGSWSKENAQPNPAKHG